jgi:tRNA (adenine57-N1/adenine58-N1)-methyltransferase
VTALPSPAPDDALQVPPQEGSARGEGVPPFRARVFAEGDSALLYDRRRRRYMIALRRGGASDVRGGRVSHDDLLGRGEGTTVRSTRGERFLVLRPTLAEFVLEMPRGAQVVYPKDLGAILIAADVFPGARVLEAGTGSGALTMALVRAVGAAGRVVSYELREDFARVASRNIARYLGETPALVLRRRDLSDGVLPADAPVDRVILDLPEPWRMLPQAEGALNPGGIVLAYLPTVPQVMRTVETMQAAGTFALIETAEVLLRPWNVDGRSVRPAHRMVAHTGFLVTARRVETGAGAVHHAASAARAASASGQAEDADDDQVDRDDETEEPRDDQNQDARDQGDER